MFENLFGYIQLYFVFSLIGIILIIYDVPTDTHILFLNCGLNVITFFLDIKKYLKILS